MPMMNTTVATALRLCLLLPAFALAGCYVSNVDVCHAACDTGRRCGLLSDAMAANCHTDCENNRGKLEDLDRQQDRDCKNYNEVRAKTLDCGKQDCNKVNSCVANVDRTCVK